MSEANARLAWTSLLVWACALLALGAQVPGYSQAVHPMALPGARGMPGAGLFNAMVFVLPGSLVALVAWRLRTLLPARSGAAARIGATLLLLSALAFAVQGVLPIERSDTDGAATALHASAWTTWWIAFAAGSLALALAVREWRVPMLLSLAAVLANAPLAGVWLPGGIAQRIACACWFAGIAWIASGRLSRGAA
ncbi:DUF998 domain-containing protein [Luteimonas viscosa]|uniref:DUF998 domain-containing protein n=1 Tax=Luteimonas viscosa TaxID=1132694 RepID=A0A5D4XRW9_9GAMM|nr:DUF998 domain-containing protein [Luteimonas viscosa]TYT27346.1 DUF998 domain-containing protein [Luteimonas viscosa]